MFRGWRKIPVMVTSYMPKHETVHSCVPVYKRSASKRKMMRSEGVG